MMNIEEALICATICKAAMKVEGSAREYLETMYGVSAISECILFIQGNAEVLCVVLNGTAYVAFRGTKGFKDIKTDFHITKSEADDGEFEGKVHTGFFKYWKSLHNRITGWMHKQKRIHYKTKVVLTGHSLGAAAATIEYRVNRNHYDVCYIFGSPRVGNHAFAKNYGPRTPHRFSVLGDPVTSIPTFFRWSHIGNVNVLTKAGIKETSPLVKIIVLIRNLLFAFIQGSLLRQIASTPNSHLIDTYIERLKHAKRIP